MNRRTFLTASAAATVPFLGCAGGGQPLLNCSYDATRELYRRLNRAFAEHHLAEHGKAVRVTPSHGGSGSQARAVIDGLQADVVTLAMWPDTEAVAKKKLIQPGWVDRFPHRACPYTSTIVFVVRRGNPLGIRDWSDLAAHPSVKVIAANPKTSGAAKLGVVAAWGSVVAAGGSPREADDLVRAVYRKVPALESSSRVATVTFARKQIGDVHLTWENEAWLEQREMKGDLEIVYPARSILAEPHVAIVDANVERNGTRAVAEAYLNFLYANPSQDVIAENYYRPSTPAAAARHAEKFGKLDRFPIASVLPGGWPEAQKRFFDDGALFDQVFQSGG